MVHSGVSIHPDCITTYNELKLGKGVKYIIFKISDDKKEIVVEYASDSTDYEDFRNRLVEAKDSNGKSAPRYGVYDVDYEIEGEGKRKKITFISWVPFEAPPLLRMVYSSTTEHLKSALSPQLSLHADDKGEIEWAAVLLAAGGKTAITRG